MPNRKLTDYRADEIVTRIKARAYEPLRALYRRVAPSRLLLARSYLLDEEWYQQQYPDVTAAGTTPVKHYLRHGARENRDPGPFFSTAWYRQQYPDIAESHQNPLVHYLRKGEDEGRLTGPSFRRRRGVQKQKLGTQAQKRATKRRDELQARFKQGLVEFLKRPDRIDLTPKPQLASHPKVSVVIVTWNKAEFTLATLSNLATVDDANLEVIVVDNGSTDETRDVLAQVDGLKTISNEENQGFVRAVNQGSKEATGEFLLLLNNDALPRPAAIARAATYLTDNPNVAAVGGRLILPSGLLQEAGSIIWSDGSCEGYLRGEPPEIGEAMFVREVDYCSAAFLMIRRSVWLKLAGFDERYSPAYYEEVDFCARALSTDQSIVYLPYVVVDHFEFASTSGLSEASVMQLERRNLFTQSQNRFLSSQLNVNTHGVSTARNRNQAPTILIIDDQIPRESAGQGFARIVRMVHSLRKAGFQVCIAAISHEGAVDWPAIWQELGPDVECIPDLSPKSLEAFLTERVGSYQLLLVSRPHNMRYIKDLAERRPGLISTPIIYDAEALATANSLTQEGQALSPEKLRETAKDEIALATIADAITCVSPVDQAAFRANTDIAVFLAPHALTHQPTTNDFSARRGLLFFGALTDLKSPNVESIDWFLSEVWPKLPVEFRARNPLRLVGQVLPSLARRWTSENVEVTGLLPDLHEVANQAKVFIAPTRRAQGIPIKVVEAASLGVPSVITPVLAQQLGWSAGKEALTATQPDEFAAAIVTLSEDESLWQKLRINSISSAQSISDPKRFSRGILDAIFSTGIKAPSAE